MIYIIFWLLVLFAFLCTQITGNRTRVFGFVALLAIAFIAIFRGPVGTDTNTYELIMENLQGGTYLEGMEPGFVGLGWLYVNVFGSTFVAVRAVSATVFMMLFLYLFRTNGNERFALLAYFIPAFVFQYSMNALRIGMASILLLLAVQAFGNLKKKPSFILAGLALCFHYSSLFSLLFLWASQIRWARLSTILAIACFTFLMTIVFYLNASYFLMKLSAYQLSESPGALSGLSKVLIISLFLVSVLFSRLPGNEKLKLFSLGSGFTLLFWMLSGISYAGLRFLDLMSFALPLSIIATHSRLGLVFSLPIKFGMFMAGLLAVFSTYRNFLMEAGDGPSPFLPYDFFFVNGLF